jgi:hypothetical protein
MESRSLSGRIRAPRLSHVWPQRSDPLQARRGRSEDPLVSRAAHPSRSVSGHRVVSSNFLGVDGQRSCPPHDGEASVAGGAGYLLSAPSQFTFKDGSSAMTTSKIPCPKK